MSTIRIRVVRRCAIAGRPVPAGEVIRLAPLDASLALDSGRCELVSADDLPELLQARRADNEHKAAAASRQPPACWPWQPL